MHLEQIRQQLMAGGYPVISENSIWDKEKTSVLAELSSAGSSNSPYLGKVVLPGLNEGNNQTMVEFEKFLVEGGIPYSRARK